MYVCLSECVCKTSGRLRAGPTGCFPDVCGEKALTVAGSSEGGGNGCWDRKKLLLVSKRDWFVTGFSQPLFSNETEGGECESEKSEFYEKERRSHSLTARN